MVPPFSFSKIFEVEAEIINIVNIYITFTIMMIPASTTKKMEKEKGGLLKLHLNFKINNIINIGKNNNKIKF